MTKGQWKKHLPEEIVAKLRDADAMLNAGKGFAAVLQPWRSVTRRLIVDGPGTVAERWSVVGSNVRKRSW